MKTKILIIAIATFSLFSCTNEPTGASWGETNYYSDFLFKKYEPIIMEKTLSFEFNEDALRLVTSDIVFEIVEKNENGKFTPAADIIVYKNRKKCANNLLTIKSSENEITLGIEFTKEAREGNHTLYLNVKNTGGLERIDYLELTDGFYVKKDNVYNPLAELLFWLLVIITVILLVCYIIAHFFVNPGTKFSKVFIDYNDGAGEQRINMGSAYKLLCTNKKTRFSVFSIFFVGVVKVEVNDFWTSPLTIKSGARNNIRLSGTVKYELDNEETVRKEPFTITNENGQKATITTA